MQQVATSGDSKGQPRCALSIVTMVYKSRPYLDEFIELAVTAATRIAGQSYELIFVVDGSPDDSLQHLRSKQRQNPKITIVDLSRNFGHHQAAWCGLHTARGDQVFIIDCDLEVSPAVLESFADTMTQSGADVVLRLPGISTRRLRQQIPGRCVLADLQLAIDDASTSQHLYRAFDVASIRRHAADPG
jgi:putative glycosyltransferase